MLSEVSLGNTDSKQIDSYLYVYETKAQETKTKNQNRFSSQTFESLYNQYSNMAFQFAMKKLNNIDDAEEVLNDVMLDVWRKLSHFEGKSKLSTWIMRITHNKSVDLLRKRIRHENRTHIECETISFNDECRDLDLDLGIIQQNKHLRNKIEQLPKKFKEIIYLGYYSGMNHKEISSMLSIPVGTVKTRSMKGKLLLKKKLLH